MGLVVQRRVEIDGPIEDSVDDPSNEILRNIKVVDSELLVLLRGLDPVSDAVFNQLQIPRVIEELRLLSNVTKGTSQPIEASLSLAEGTLGVNHRYLVFVGD